jgi:xanthine dehydrogenase accessory factor
MRRRVQDWPVYDIAEQVQTWLDEAREVLVAQVVATRGFSSGEPAAAAAWTPGAAPVGRLIEGVDAHALGGGGLVEFTMSDSDAVAAGLACGGAASILVRPASAYPPQLWERLVAREPVCLVTTLRDGVPEGTEVFTPATIRDTHSFGAEVPRLLGRGVTGAAVIQGEPTLVAVAMWPVPALLVVGDGLIADALRDTAALLGWPSHVTPAADDAVEAAAGLQRSDAVVVLSHDRAVDGPVLAAALAGEAGYVGALGSRRTQAARREWLTGHGVLGKDQARIHGPAGLDIDAHTPGEIAVSIVAEIIAGRSGSSGGALRERTGPVHGEGVHAPPPRY